MTDSLHAFDEFACVIWCIGVCSVALAYPLTCVATLIDVSDSTHSLHVFACKTLQHTATHCNTLQHTATHCNILQDTATHCSRQREQKARQTDTSAATRYHTLHNIPTHYNTQKQIDKTDRYAARQTEQVLQNAHTLQRTASHCTTLQHTAIEREIWGGYDE